MKKNILIILTVFSLIACCRDEDLSDIGVAWYIKNSTDYPIFVKTERVGILPGDSVTLSSFRPALSETPFFEMLYESLEYWMKNTNRNFKVFSKNGEVLKTWYYTEKEEFGKQFFNEEYWKFSEMKYNQTIGSGWVFEITNQDITLINEE